METKPYLIALDLDGTLLKDDKTISEDTLRTIRKVKEAGHYVCISTGRPYRSSSMYYQQMGLTTPIVNFNGAFVHHPQDESWGRYHTSLPLEVVKQLVDISETYSVHNVLAEVIDDVYFHYHDERLIDAFNMNTTNVTVGDLRDNLGEDVTSVLIHAKEEDVPDIRAYLSDVHAEVIDHRRWAAPWHVIEIIKSGMNKAVGLKKSAITTRSPLSASSLSAMKIMTWKCLRLPDAALRWRMALIPSNKLRIQPLFQMKRMAFPVF